MKPLIINVDFEKGIVIVPGAVYQKPDYDPDFAESKDQLLADISLALAANARQIRIERNAIRTPHAMANNR